MGALRVRQGAGLRPQGPRGGGRIVVRAGHRLRPSGRGVRPPGPDHRPRAGRASGRGRARRAPGRGSHEARGCCSRAWPCCRPPAAPGTELVAEARGIRGVVKTARERGAYRCAPGELALAEAHVEFAEQELSDGDYFRARDHLGIADWNAREAMRLASDPGCQARRQPGRRRPRRRRPTPATSARPRPRTPTASRTPTAARTRTTTGTASPTAATSVQPRPRTRMASDDGDGCPDGDDDGDGVPDASDKCPPRSRGQGRLRGRRRLRRSGQRQGRGARRARTSAPTRPACGWRRAARSPTASSPSPPRRSRSSRPSSSRAPRR